MRGEARPLPADLTPLVRHLESAYPREGCGVVLRGRAGLRFVPMENAYDRLRGGDPDGSARSARTAYAFDPRAWLALLLAADDAGEAVACIVHSHADADAAFSSEDWSGAAPDGEPLLPGVAYLVVAVHRGRATSARLHWWEGDLPCADGVALTA